MIISHLSTVQQRTLLLLLHFSLFVFCFVLLFLVEHIAYTHAIHFWQLCRAQPIVLLSLVLSTFVYFLLFGYYCRDTAPAGAVPSETACVGVAITATTKVRKSERAT
jgi:hypothetical protein